MSESPLPVKPVIDVKIRGLCVHPYDGHPRGCPSFNSGNRSCPPHSKKFDEAYDLSFPVYVVVNEFDIGAHVERMKLKHPGWSDKQLRCCLYWQGKARKELDAKIRSALTNAAFCGYVAEKCPEGMGVNLTETLKAAGIYLEWPPTKIARQVALLARPKSAGTGTLEKWIK